MLRLHNHQPSLWESVLPSELFRMSDELTKVDRLLDDRRFFTPFLEKFNTRIGRPTVPIATYVRMMYLKRRYQLGYETLVKEVTDSFSWRRFCHLSIDDPVPDSTTLIKLTHKYSEAILHDLNDALVLKLKEGKVMKKRAGKDSPALTEASAALSRVAEKVVDAGQDIYAHLHTLIERPPIVRRLAQQLATWVEITEQVIEQTKRVMDGCRHIPGRIVSLFDTEARPIRRGKLRVDTEFGHKVLIGETDHGIITTFKVLEGNPSDTVLLKPAVQGHKRLFRKRLKAVAADRGFYSRGNEEWLQGTGVTQVSIPARGKMSRHRHCYQQQPWFKRLQRFRAGVEAKISLLHRKFGLKRSLIRGSPGTETWVGQGILTHITRLRRAARIL